MPEEWNITNEPEKNNYKEPNNDKGYVYITNNNTLDVYDKSNSSPIIIT